MIDATPRQRTRYTTRYVIEASHPVHPPVVVGFAERTSRSGLLRSMQFRGQALIDHCEIGPADEITFHTKPRTHAKVAGWTIGFTGQTERDLLRHA